MSQFIGLIITLITTPPGNVVYHLVLAFSIGAALQGAVHLLRSTEFPQARRTVFGLTLLIALQLMLFVASGISFRGMVDPGVIFPPLDRAITLISLIWIIWLWVFPEPVRLADLATILLSALVIVLFGLTMALWARTQSAVSFNLSLFEKIWQALGLIIILLGIFAMVRRKPNGWGNGLAMVGIAFFGNLISLIYPQEGSFPGIVRLLQMASYPILLTLSQRYPTPATEAAKKEAISERPLVERRRYSTDPKTFHALMSLAAESNAGKIGHAMTRGIAQAMLADLCFLITLAEDKNLNIACGYDLIREERLDGTAIDKEVVPLLANAIQRGRPLRLPASSTSSDLKNLGQILGLANPGHLLSVPIITQGKKSLGGFLILSPYSNRLWSAEDQTYLSNVSGLFVSILERTQRMSILESERETNHQQLHQAQERMTESQKQLEQISGELESLRGQAALAQEQTEKIAVLVTGREDSKKAIEQLTAEKEQMRIAGAAWQEELQSTIDQLKADNEKLRSASTAGQEELQKTVEQLQADNEKLRASLAAAPESPEKAEQMEQDLRKTLEEMARMQNSLAIANRKILELEKNPPPPITTEQVEVIASISQELRQPMSSIIGYTDLLLGESVGILGALQRKFVERIKASTERIGGLVDDLIQITTLETGQRQFTPELIDINLIIDNAMAYTGTQLREKNITLQLDIPEEMPRIQTDRDALQQTLIHLLQNASGASPSEGTVTLRVQTQKEEKNNYLLVQVADTGGGITSDDLPRVFARRYRADNSLIQGLGDTGVGLSIARSLVEAQNGRIWVETNTGVGSVFSVLLPVTIEGEDIKAT